MESEIIKILQDITNQSISSDVKKVIIIDLDLKVSVEQFRKFQEWLISRGFSEMKLTGDGLLLRLFMELDYKINGVDESDSKTRQILYRHTKDNKTVYITYTVDDLITIDEIIYFEKV
jgi:hypothetical protein